MSLFKKHEDLLNTAIKALHSRTFYAAYPEHPSPKIYGETADKDGQDAFKAHLNKNYDGLLQDNEGAWRGEEDSPYLGDSLHIKYPFSTADKLVGRAKLAAKSWRDTSVADRAGILIESLDRVKNRFFEMAYATMHTTGQGYMMAFQASGPHGNDRALEAIAAGYEEQKRFPEKVIWDKPMGKFNITLEKEWVTVPKGVSVVIGCSTFPTWNTVPGMYASLITGNPVIIKPHPKAVYSIAIVVEELQKVLKENNLDVHICQLGADTSEYLITKELAEHKDVKLIDFTGNSAFGSYLEGIAGKTVFTEKTGVNSIILDSCENIDKVMGNLAFSLSLYSGQMCTAPQNFFIPKGGVKTPEGVVSFDECVEKFKEQVTGLANNPNAGPFVLGAVQNPATMERVKNVSQLGGDVVLAPEEIENPMFAKARTCAPAVLTVDASKKEVFAEELFGGIALFIKTDDTAHSVQLASEMATEHGAISCGAYTTDNTMKQHIKEEMSLSFTPVSFNLTGGIYVNQNAAFSDFHVTGGNPAGNASFTNPEYVCKRFVWVGFREPVSA